MQSLLHSIVVFENAFHAMAHFQASWVPGQVWRFQWAHWDLFWFQGHHYPGRGFLDASAHVLQWSEKLINLKRLAVDMRLNNQSKVGLTCVACLLVQGYIFTYVLFVEPHPLLSIVPLFPYLVYVYARGKRTWYFNKPFYWIGLIIAITLLDILPFAVASMRAWSSFPAEALGSFSFSVQEPGDAISRISHLCGSDPTWWNQDAWALPETGVQRKGKYS